VVRPFDPPDRPWGSGHRGVDLRAEAGRAVRSPADGTIVFAGPVAGRGVVVVSHAGGLRSTFEPVEGGVPVGRHLMAGATVGRVSDQPSHCLPASCLHWGVLRGSTYLDPLSLLRRTPIVLLPLP
jgi:murein DD-endopeptidase MepM/ murein hydrolase activator NlpD